jgi:lambda repressor-like predicted transcriptional regulator
VESLAQAARAAALRSQGRSVRAIAAELGVAKSTLARALK